MFTAVYRGRGRCPSNTMESNDISNSTLFFPGLSVYAPSPSTSCRHTAGTILCIFFLFGWAYWSSNHIFFCHGVGGTRTLPSFDLATTGGPMADIAYSRLKGWLRHVFHVFDPYLLGFFLSPGPGSLQISKHQICAFHRPNWPHDIISLNFLSLNQMKKANVAYISPIPYIQTCASFCIPKEIPRTLYTERSILSTLNVRRSSPQKPAPKLTPMPANACMPSIKARMFNLRSIFFHSPARPVGASVFPVPQISTAVQGLSKGHRSSFRKCPFICEIANAQF